MNLLRVRPFACSLFFLAMSAFTVAETPAKPYSSLFVFGDSYSDTGASYVDSDGPTAVSYLAQELKIPFTYFGDLKSEGKSLNFAQSGATTVQMQKQVDRFVKLVQSGKLTFDPQKAMFFFAGGLNDNKLPAGTSTDKNIEGEIETLYALGARRFMVAILPTKIPAFAKQGEQFNPLLATVPQDMRLKHADIEIRNSKWGAFFDFVVEHPEKYGITDTQNRCAGRAIKHEDPTPCPNPEAHFYFHTHHPSTATHRAVGHMLYQEAMGADPFASN